MFKKNNMKNTFVGIMAGGAGTRFWPVSRETHPKQFIDILGGGETLLQQTFNRFSKLCPKENIFFITNTKYESIILDQIKGIDSSQIIKEPSRRNTAPCIAYAANKIHDLNPNANLIIAPSDHHIQKEDSFLKILKSALNVSEKESALVTLGIKPDRPDTGYGYIQYDRANPIEKGVHRVKMFTEKPNEEIARKFIRSGEFLWNSGIFIWQTDVILKAIEKYLPDMYELFNDSKKNQYNTNKEKQFISNAYMQCKNISIDYGIMERAQRVLVLPSEFGWSDLGTWNSVYTKSKKDKDNNVLQIKEHLLNNTKNCLIKGRNDKLIVVDGLSDYIIVDDKDVTLILPRSKEQDVKKILTEIKQKKGNHYL